MAALIMAVELTGRALIRYFIYPKERVAMSGYRAFYGISGSHSEVRVDALNCPISA